MYTIIPAKDATLETLKELQASGRDKLLFIENISGSMVFKMLINKAMLSFLQIGLPAAMSANRKHANINIYPYEYGLPYTAIDNQSTLARKAILQALIFELEPHGYKVEHTVNDDYRIHWE